MAYADYAFYRDVYFGTLIPEDDFPRLALRATDYIDYITMGRAAGKTDEERVQKACCAAAEGFFLAENARDSSTAGGPEMASQTVGGWSATYRSAEETRMNSESATYREVTRYLLPLGLLYRGGRC